MIKKTAVTLHPENPKWRLKLTKWAQSGVSQGQSITKSWASPNHR